MRQGVLIVAVIVVAVLVGSSAWAQTPLGTALTYQGELSNGGSPANGAFDLRFSLFDAAAGGSQIGETLCADNVSVSGGRFTALLDFGAVFSGERRFLQIEVRQDSGLGCADAGGYSVLTPRQELTATANAAFALNAATAGDAATLGGRSASFFSNAANLMGTVPGSGLSGSYTSALTLSNPANVFSGNGAAITNLNATNISAGVLDAARMPINWPAGGDLTGLYPNPTIAPGAVTLSKLDAGVQSVLSNLVNMPSVPAPLDAVGWGQDLFGETTVPGLPSGVTYVAVEGGGNHSLGVRSDGLLVAWGSNLWGQCNVPALPPGVRYVAASGGSFSSLALRSDGTVVAFGWNLNGQLNVPALPSGVTYTAVSAGVQHSLGLRSDGTAIGWGSNGFGELDVPSLPAGVTYIEVDAGVGFSVGLRSDGTVVAWGDNAQGQVNVPALPAGVTYTAVSARGEHAVALRSDGTVVAWGNNAQGQLNVPALPAGLTYTAVSSGYSHTVALRSDGSVVGWGTNDVGQTNVPALPSGLAYIAVSCGSQHCLAMRSGPGAPFLETTSGLRVGSAAPAPPAGGISISGPSFFADRLSAASFHGDGAGLTNLSSSNLTGTVPQTVLPVHAWSTGSLQSSVLTSQGGVYTAVPGVSQVFAMRHGVAVISWSTTAFTNSANTGFLLRVRAQTGGNVTWSPPTRFFFNQGGVHMTISGNAVVAIPFTGNTTFELEVTRIGGAGGYAVDFNDVFTATIINVGQ